MATTLLNAPLVELIAEIRWSPGIEAVQATSMQPGGVNTPAFYLASSEFADFFSRFGNAVAELSYSVSERLVPPEIPFLMVQPVYRYKQQAQDQQTSLYQVGPGLFTANAVPPYQTWDTFSPVVKAGVNAILESRSEAERDSPFIATSLRYIDAFGVNLTRGMDVATFMRDILGVDVKLPKGMVKHLATDATYKPSIQVQIPMHAGMIMSVAIGEGIINNNQSIVMDTTVSTTTPIAANIDAVMQAMNVARTSIHDMFFEITGPIKELMKPQGAE